MGNTAAAFVMIILFAHAGGGWDELLLAVIAFGVLWVAVRLASRKSLSEDDESVASTPVESGRVGTSPTNSQSAP